jgi:hypothetical protein
MPGPIRTAFIIGKNEKRALIGLLASFLLWWGFVGSKKYGIKGMS